MILTTNPESLLAETLTAKVKPKYRSLPKTVVGSENNNNSEPAEYKLTEYTYKYEGATITTLSAEQQVGFDTDKEEIKWCFWVEGDLMNRPQNKYKERIEVTNRTALAESLTDFTLETNRGKFKKAIEDKGYLEATTEVVTEGGVKINKLTITFSKWLDDKNVYVEPFRNSPDHNATKNYVKTTAIKAAPEVIDAYWLDSQGKRITTVGFETDIKFYIETLGLKDETIKLRLFDYDGPINPADSIPWNGNIIEHQFVIADRKFTQDYFVEAQNAAAYANAHSWVDGDLDVYIDIALLDTSILISLEERYANIGFLENSEATLFLAKKEEVVVNSISYTQYNKIDNVYPGMTAYLVAQIANLSGDVSFSISEETPLLLNYTTDKLPLLVNDVSETDITATIEDGYAVVAVKFQELGSATYDEWNDDLDTDSEEGLTSKLIIKAQINSQEYLSTDNFNLKSSTIRYILKTDGIIKHHREVSDKARYIFKDDQDNLHYLLKRDFLNIDWVSRDKSNRLTENYIYKKDKIKLVKISEGDAYSSGVVKFKFLKVNSATRKYIDSDCLACLLAAMIENQIEDLRFNGFSTSTGTAGVSSSHWNGMVGDLGYLNTNKDGSATWLSSSSAAYSTTPNWTHNADFDYDRQILFNESLYKYGFSKYKRRNNNKIVQMYSENFTRTINGVNETKLLPHTKHYRTTSVFHFHHLHLQGLDLSFFEIRE